MGNLLQNRKAIMKIVMLFLTCAHQAEADKISTYLLENNLIACAKTMQISAKFQWQGSVDTTNEILLIMDTLESKFSEIERQLKKLHSYTTFVLTALEVTRVSSGVADWIKKSLKCDQFGTSEFTS